MHLSGRGAAGAANKTVEKVGMLVSFFQSSCSYRKPYDPVAWQTVQHSWFFVILHTKHAISPHCSLRFTIYHQYGDCWNITTFIKKEQGTKSQYRINANWKPLTEENVVVGPTDHAESDE